MAEEIWQSLGQQRVGHRTAHIPVCLILLGPFPIPNPWGDGWPEDCIQFNAIIHLFNEYVLSTYYMQGTVMTTERGFHHKMAKPRSCPQKRGQIWRETRKWQEAPGEVPAGSGKHLIFLSLGFLLYQMKARLQAWYLAILPAQKLYDSKPSPSHSGSQEAKRPGATF